MGLAAPPWVAGFTLAAYLLGVAVSQVLYGPVSDRSGRRGPLLVGCAVSIAGSIGCATGRSAGARVAFRMVQALGGGAGTVLSRAIVRDTCGTRESANMYALLMLVMGTAPVVAPTIGGQILAVASWRAIFVALGAFGAACLLVT